MDKTDILVWSAAPTLLVWLVSVFIRCKLYRGFPFFFAYIITQLLVAVIRLSVSGNYQTFFKVFWGTEIIYAILALLALHEVFHWVFLEYYAHWRWFWLLFPGMVTLVLLFSLWYAVEHPPVQANRVISLVLVAGFAVNFIEIGLFLLFFGLVKIFSLSWWDYSFSIVVGFAVSAFGALGAYWLRSEFGTRFATLAKYAPPVSYILAVVLWLAVFRRPEPESRWKLSIGPEEFLKEILSYGELLKKIRERLK